VPQVGQPCGLELYVREDEINYRRGAYWTADGGIVVGKVDDSQGEGISLYCGRHGAWATPDVGDYL
jgi:hypothetical protein